LHLEITEGVLIEDDPSTLATFRELKSLGVKLMLDDFGTGYSSLSYLKLLPMDFLKIDRSFVEGLGKDPKDEGIVSAVIDLARVLGMEEAWKPPSKQRVCGSWAAASLKGTYSLSRYRHKQQAHC
jgi:EAL domain-containing protein (putative c-di-GMP-specific phosphodiesterase class I)